MSPDPANPNHGHDIDLATVGATQVSARPRLPTISDVGSPTLLANRYAIQALVGAGGMGSVYRALDRELDEVVALKLLSSDMTAEPGAVERFRLEVKLARRIAHANVVRTHDLGEDGAQKFLTMEYVEGVSLGRRLQSEGRLDILEFMRIAQQICAGIGAAHQAGVLHRDLKPDNVLLGKTGRVAITDFGIARATAGNRTTYRGIVGTPAYMAPEQLQNEVELDARADIYALGTMLFEMLTGERAWPGDNMIVVAMARLQQPPPDPRKFLSVPDGLADILIKSMAQDRNQRFASAAELAAALKTAVTPTFLRDVAGEVPTRRLDITLTPPAQQALPQHHAKAVAVLPMAVSGDEAWHGEALTEEVIDVLSTTRGLRVRPLSAVLKVTADDAQEVGKLLGVDAVVSGTLRKLGARWRLAVRAVSVADGFQLWAQRFEFDAAEVLNQADAIAQAVAGALTVDLHGAGKKLVVDAKVAEIYMRARHLLRAEWMAGGMSAISLLAEGLQTAPDDAGLLSLYAMACARQAFYGLDQDRTLGDARATAERAIAVAPDSGECWAALAQVRMYSRDPAGAAHAFKKALLRSPGHFLAQAQLGSLLAEAGRFDQAQLHLRAAQSLDPFNANARWDLARIAALQGDWDTADAVIQEPLTDMVSEVARRFAAARFSAWRMRPCEVEPLPEGLTTSNLLLYVRGAIALYRRVAARDQLTPDDFAQLMAGVQASNARLAATRAQFAAEMLAACGYADRALELVEGALAQALSDYAWWRGCPLFAELRTTERGARITAALAERSQQLLAAVDSAV